MSVITDTVSGVLDTVLGGIMPDVPQAPSAPEEIAKSQTQTTKAPKAPTEVQVEDAKKRSLLSQQGRQGRKSTILTSTSGDRKGTVMGGAVGTTRTK